MSGPAVIQLIFRVSSESTVNTVSCLPEPRSSTSQSVMKTYTSDRAV